MKLRPGGRIPALCFPRAAVAAAAAAALPALTIGADVTVRGSVDELQGRFTGRFRYADGTEACFVELPSGVAVTVPLRDVEVRP